MNGGVLMKMQLECAWLLTADMRTALFLLSTMLLFACSRPEVIVPESVIPRDTMISILSDMHLAEAAIQLRNMGSGDTARAESYARYRYVFKKHNISIGQFRQSFAFYRSQPEYFNKMYKEVITRLSEIQAKEQRRPGL